jgi:hypothetical protein
MAPPRAKRKLESISLDTLKSDGATAIRAARQRGGVRVVNSVGVELFRLSIPSTPLPE